MAHDFSGTTQSVSYGDISDVGSNKISIAAWVYPDDFSIAYGYVNKRKAHNQNNAFVLGNSLSSSNLWELQLGNSAGNAVGAYYYATRNEAASNWYHFAATYNGSNGAGSRCNLYVNGSAKSVTAGTDADIGTFHNSTDSLVLGRVNSTGNYYYNGRMAEVAIWAGELTAADVAALAKGARPIDVRPDLLSFYAPLVRNTEDAITGTVGTATTTVIEHPRATRRSPRIWRQNPAAAVSGRIMSSLTRHGGLAGLGGIAGTGGGLAA